MTGRHFSSLREAAPTRRFANDRLPSHYGEATCGERSRTTPTTWHHLKFNIHHKQRYIYKLVNQIRYLKAAPIRVFAPRGDVFIIGRSGLGTSIVGVRSQE
jgi:hypothetical protein